MTFYIDFFLKLCFFGTFYVFLELFSEFLLCISFLSYKTYLDTIGYLIFLKISIISFKSKNWFYLCVFMYKLRFFKTLIKIIFNNKNFCLVKIKIDINTRNR